MDIEPQNSSYSTDHVETPKIGELPKLRSACDYCHSSKVRCSGEKSGCRRCTHGKRTCRYSASNMGKAGNKQQKRKAPPLALAEEREELEPLTPIMTPNLTLWPQFNPSVAGLDLETFADNLDGVDFDGDIYSMDTTDTFSNTGDFSGFDMLMPPTSPAVVPPQLHSQSRLSISSASSMSTQSPSTSSNTNDLRNATGLISHIIELSQRLSKSDSPLAIEEALNLSNLYLPTMESDIAKLPIDLSRMSTILMIIICLTQMLALFENCITLSTIKKFFDVKEGPKLVLGSFQVDIESQRQLKLQIVQKELTRVFKIAGSLKNALHQSPVASESQNQMYVALVLDIQKRLRFLVDILRQG